MRVFPAITLFLGVLLLAGAAIGASGDSQAEKLFHQAQKAEHAGQIVQAYVLYAEAAAADPTNIEYWSRAQALRPAASLKEASPAQLPTLASEKVDRTLFGKITPADLEEARQPLPPAKLDAEPGRRDYDLRGDSKALWEQVAGILHLKVLFDPDYKPTPAFRFQLTGADYREALTALESATDSFLVPVSARFIFVANDSTQKRTEFERTAAVVLPFPETIDQKEIQELGNAIRGALDIRRLTVDPVQHLILIRDAVTKVRLARKLLSDLLRPRAQVRVDIEILTTDVTSTLNYGLSLPTSFAISSFLNRANFTNAFNSFASGYSTFLGFGGGASMLGLGVTGAQLFATVSKSNSESVFDAQLVAVDGLPATLHVGEKYPIITNGYFGNTAGSGTVYTPPPTVNFEDIGLLMKVTPRIISSDEVYLDVDAEFKMLGATTSDGIPVILNTQYQSKVDVAAGEWAVLSGLMTAQEAKAITGLPLLSYIPLLRNTTITKDRGETLIVLKPHVTVAPPAENASWSAWAGTETRLATEF